MNNIELIKKLVKNTTCKFSSLRCNIVYYEVESDGAVYVFPVSIEDLGNATINAEEKGLTMMRYIRKAVEDGTLIKCFSEFSIKGNYNVHITGVSNSTITITQTTPKEI